MTMDEINKIIAKYDYRLTPALAFSIAFQAAKKERDVCAELCLQGTELPVQTHALNIIKAERERISNLIKARGRKVLKDMLIEEKHSCPDWDYMAINKDSPEYEACLCFPEIECTDEQLIEEVRRRGFVIRNAKIHRKWVGITCEEIDEIYRTGWFDVHYDLAFAIEAKLKEKNGGTSS